MSDFNSSSPAEDVTVLAVSTYGTTSVLTTASNFVYLGYGAGNCTGLDYTLARNATAAVAASANGDVLHVKVTAFPYPTSPPMSRLDSALFAPPPPKVF